MLNKLKKQISKLLPKGQFARGVSILVGGTAGAQLLMILASPLLTRLYTPEDFGLLAVYAGLLSLFTVISSLRYELAIPLPESDQEAAHVTLLSFFIVVIITIISGLITIFAGNQVAILLGSPKLAEYFWLLPLGVFLIGSYQVFNYWAIRTKSFPIIARTKIRQTITTVAIQLMGFKLGGITLLVGQTMGQGAGTYTLAKPALKRAEFKRWQFKDLWKMAKRYKEFPLYSTWGGFANTASLQLPPIMLAILFSPIVAGFYALANRVLALPASVVGSAIGNVFLANAVESRRTGELRQLFENVFQKLAMIVTPAIVILLIGAPNLFAFVFGEEWRIAGEYARWMAVWLGVVFIASPLSILFTVFEAQLLGMLFQLMMLSVRIISILIGYYLHDVITTIILFSFSSTLCWLLFLLWAAKKSGSSFPYIFFTFIKSSLLALMMGLPFLIGALQSTTSIWWGSLFISGAIISSYYLYQLKRAY